MALLSICSRCEPEYGSVGLIGYNYQSVKDSIKDLGLSIKAFRVPVMAIGRLVSMNEDDYTKAVSTRKKDISEGTADDINKLAGV